VSGPEVAQAWKTLPASRWNTKMAAHLLRRAGFGGTPDDRQLASERGMEDTVAWLLEIQPTRDPVETAARDLHTMFSQDEQSVLRGRWVYRMINTPRPLEEKLTLFWHGEFATSLAKVRNVAWMREQNRTFRRHALGSFRELLLAISRDPAMIRWLDNDRNRKGQPNENYARELFELFSLGIGHYSERDVQEAARAFTGWHIRGDAFFFYASQHDNGSKTVFGKTGNFSGDRIIELIMGQKRCAQFLAERLFSFFAYAGADAALIQPLAARIRKDDYQLAGALGMLLRSRIFYSRWSRLRQIKSPAEFVIGTVQALMARVNPAQLAQQMAGMSQNLFFPPDVKGWDGGQAWISSTLLFARQKFARALVLAEGNMLGMGTRTDLIGPLTRAGITGARQTVDFYIQRLLPDGVSPGLHKRLLTYLEQAKGPRRTQVAELVHLILSSPEYQLA